MKNLVYKMRKILFLFLFVFTIAAVGDDYSNFKKMFVEENKNIKAGKFSQWLPGIKKSIVTNDKIIALTFDACGGRNGSGYNKNVIEYLRAEKIPATLFINSRWIDANPALFMELAKDKLFEIENHGLQHRPGCITGAEIYGIKGCTSVGELVDEIELNARKIEQLTGRRPIFFRAGTAYFDEAGVKLCYGLNHIPLNFDIISGDPDLNLTVDSMNKNILRKVKPGSIIIMHFNRPKTKTSDLLKTVVPELRKMGYSFVKLAEYKERLGE